MLKLSLIDDEPAASMPCGPFLPGASIKYICSLLRTRQDAISQDASWQAIIPVSKLLVWVTGGRVGAQSSQFVPNSTPLRTNHMPQSPDTSPKENASAPSPFRGHEDMTSGPYIFMSALRRKRLYGSPCTVELTSHLCHTQSRSVWGTTDAMPRVHVHEASARMTSTAGRRVS
jgi:hypothetical protein